MSKRHSFYFSFKLRYPTNQLLNKKKENEIYEDRRKKYEKKRKKQQRKNNLYLCIYT